MSIKTMILGLIAVAGILSACHSTEPTHSVDWFIEHPEELKDAIAKCVGAHPELTHFRR